jgi:hypothetical protein
VDEQPEIQKPLGGVHREVTEGNRTAKGGFLRDTMKTWGVFGGPAWKPPKNWKKEIEAPQSLREIRDRAVRRDLERVVSRKVEGLWVAGAGDLDRDALDELLVSDGYEWAKEDIVATGAVTYLVETYVRSDADSAVREEIKEIVLEDADLFDMLKDA